MGADTPHISVGTWKSGLYINVHGRATQRVCATIEQLINDFLTENRDRPRLTIDLFQSAWVDSTFAGWLAGLQKRMARMNGAELFLAACSDRCKSSLEKMNLQHLFQYVDEAKPEAVREVSCPTTDRPDKATLKLMMEAHRELMGLSESNQRIFGPIVSALQRQMEG